jgi:hypothetical protein
MLIASMKVKEEPLDLSGFNCSAAVLATKRAYCDVGRLA